MAKETAEKKLLKLIETTQAQEAAATGGTQPPAAADSAAAPANEAQQVLSAVKGPGISIPKIGLPPFLSNIFVMFKGASPALAAPGSSFGLKDINKILSVGIVIMAGFLFLNFLSGWNESQKALEFGIESVPANTEPFTPSFRELKEYLDTLTQRNIFQPYEVKIAAEESKAMESALTPINERTKDLKLVGISWLDTPESASAMIENTASGVTYFLKSGEQVNSVVVKEIFADSIIITFGDEEMEMRL